MRTKNPIKSILYQNNQAVIHKQLTVILSESDLVHSNLRHRTQQYGIFATQPKRCS